MKFFRNCCFYHFGIRNITVVILGIICTSRELLCATVPNDVNASKNPSPSPSYDPNNNGSATIASGTDLYCYECSETYDSSFDPNQAPCLNNLSQITIRKCSYADNYCQVQAETYVSFRGVLSISRGCVATCPYGCYFHNYGAATQVCVSCCRSYGCNTGSGTIGHQHNRPTISWHLFLLLMQLMAMAVPLWMGHNGHHCDIHIQIHSN